MKNACGVFLRCGLANVKSETCGLDKIMRTKTNNNVLTRDARGAFLECGVATSSNSSFFYSSPSSSAFSSSSASSSSVVVVVGVVVVGVVVAIAINAFVTFPPVSLYA